MARSIISIGCILIDIALMATPFGVAMTFAPSPTERVKDYYSYFSMMPLGYGNWFPIFTAILSIIVLILFLVGIKKGIHGELNKFTYSSVSLLPYYRG